LAFKSVQIWAIGKREVNIHTLPSLKTIGENFYFGLESILYMNSLPKKKEEGSYTYSSTMGTKLCLFMGVIYRRWKNYPPTLLHGLWMFKCRVKPKGEGINKIKAQTK